MGLPVHDQFSGDGSTTAFTLTSNVAAGGLAVFGCRYEGQVQHLGDQYTVSTSHCPRYVVRPASTSVNQSPVNVSI